MRAFHRYARAMDGMASQIPFALAQALNASAEVARRGLIERTWPEHVHARNRSFLKAALTTKGTRATKRNLRVVVYDRLGRGNLLLHERGGTKRPRGKALAVPSAALQARRTAKGVPKGLRPRNLPATGPSGAFVKGDVLFQRVGAGQSRGLKLMYVLKPAAPVRADVPFQADFATTMRRTMPIQFRLALRKAMATARTTK